VSRLRFYNFYKINITSTKQISDVFNAKLWRYLFKVWTYTVNFYPVRDSYGYFFNIFVSLCYFFPNNFFGFFSGSWLKCKKRIIIEGRENMCETLMNVSSIVHGRNLYCEMKQCGFQFLYFVYLIRMNILWNLRYSQKYISISRNNQITWLWCIVPDM
jgi:hypothetical protein